MLLEHEVCQSPLCPSFMLASAKLVIPLSVPMLPDMAVEDGWKYPSPLPPAGLPAGAIVASCVFSHALRADSIFTSMSTVGEVGVAM